jgi:hypothetical protein
MHLTRVAGLTLVASQSGTEPSNVWKTARPPNTGGAIVTRPQGEPESPSPFRLRAEVLPLNSRLPLSPLLSEALRQPLCLVSRLRRHLPLQHPRLQESAPPLVPSRLSRLHLHLLAARHHLLLSFVDPPAYRAAIRAGEVEVEGVRVDPTTTLLVVRYEGWYVVTRIKLPRRRPSRSATEPPSGTEILMMVWTEVRGSTDQEGG